MKKRKIAYTVLKSVVNRHQRNQILDWNLNIREIFNCQKDSLTGLSITNDEQISEKLSLIENDCDHNSLGEDKMGKYRITKSKTY